jgi:hypothetical protein
MAIRLLEQGRPVEPRASETATLRWNGWDGGDPALRLIPAGLPAGHPRVEMYDDDDSDEDDAFGDDDYEDEDYEDEDELYEEDEDELEEGEGPDEEGGEEDEEEEEL